MQRYARTHCCSQLPPSRGSSHPPDRGDSTIYSSLLFLHFTGFQVMFQHRCCVFVLVLICWLRSLIRNIDQPGVWPLLNEVSYTTGFGEGDGHILFCFYILFIAICLKSCMKPLSVKWPTVRNPEPPNEMFLWETFNEWWFPHLKASLHSPVWTWATFETVTLPFVADWPGQTSIQTFVWT